MHKQTVPYVYLDGLGNTYVWGSKGTISTVKIM